MIIPIRDLKDTTKISKVCHDTDEPVYITKNGYDDMVIMSSKCYEAMKEKKESPRIEFPQFQMVGENIEDGYCSNVAKYSIPAIKKALDPIFKKYKINYAVLFGSYAKGLATSKSDIDLMVDSGLRGLDFFGLADDVSSAVSIPVDIFDIIDLKKKSKLEKEIKETGIRIYG